MINSFIERVRQTQQNVEIEEVSSHKPHDNAEIDAQSALSALRVKGILKSPKIVVVGSQSSGKSSLLNSIVGMDIFPTGSSITTRSPVHIQILHSDIHCAEVGSFESGVWCPTESFTCSSGSLSEQVCCHIDGHAKSHTKENDVCNESIMFRIWSPNAQNMTLVDMPGLTMTALTSEGQSEDICDKIREMIRCEVDDNTIVLLVCASRVDLETDIALDFCKRNFNGCKTVGCLTKPDLCNDISGLIPYLKDERVDMRMEYGYFCCNTKGNREDEQRFFKNGTLYNVGPLRQRLGVANLSKFLSNVLYDMIKQLLPEIVDSLKKEKSAVDDRLSSLHMVGEDVHSREPHEQAKHVMHILASFSQKAKALVLERDPSSSFACDIRDYLDQIRFDVNKIGSSNIGDKLILTAMRNSEGLRMRSPVLAVDVLEFFMKNSDTRPLKKICNIVETHLKGVNDMCNRIFAKESKFCERYPNMRDWILRIMLDQTRRRMDLITEEVKSFVESQEAYIYTQDESFLGLYASSDMLNKNSEEKLTIVRKLLSSYMGVVASIAQDHIPKIVVKHIHCMFSGMQVYLLDEISNVNMHTLLLRDKAYESEVEELKKRSRNADMCIHAIQKYK